MASPLTYGSSQAGGSIAAVAANLHHSTAMLDLSHVCDLHHSSRQRRILNPLSEARDRIHILMDTSWVRYLLSHDGNSAKTVNLKSSLIVRNK